MRAVLGFLAGVGLTLALVRALGGGGGSGANAPSEAEAERQERVDRLLRLPDAELVRRRAEIERLEGIEGRIFQALLVCVGHRLKTSGAAPGTAGAPSASSAAASAPVSASAGPKGPDAPPAASVPAASPEAPAAASTPSAPAAAAVSGGSSMSPQELRRFFCVHVRDNPIEVRSGPLWGQLFPVAAVTARPDFSGYGWVSAPEVEAKAWLRQKTCLSPQFHEGVKGDRERLAFFQRLKGRVFAGSVNFEGGSSFAKDRRGLRMHLHFNRSPRDPNQEYWYVYQHDGNRPEDVFENRYTSEGASLAGAAWRLNACSQSVSAVQERCPWGPADKYDLEYKDFYYLEGTDQVAASFYCRQRSGGRWERLGEAILTGTRGG